MTASKPKRNLSIFVLFIPTSLLILALHHLACYGLNILCIRPVTAPVVAVSVEAAPQKLRLLQDSTPSLPLPHNLSLLDFVHQGPKSKQFSGRAAEFFDGHRCDLKFFMTWISDAESFGPRELASMQSLFKTHPNACLLMVSNALDSPQGIKILHPLLRRGFRVSSLSPDFAFLFNSTPAEPWFASLSRGGVDPGEVSLGQNLSNLLRLALLYKYGGVYVDTDVIVLKSLSMLRNAIGAQTADRETGNWTRLNNAVMIFDQGHPLLGKFMEEFALTFDGNRWGHNGPYLVSRVVSRLAGRAGFEITVLPPPAFYPVGWRRIDGLFQGPRDGRHARWVEAKLAGIRSESYALHLWNRQSRSLEVEEGSVVERIMMDCCIFCNFSRSGL